VQDVKAAFARSERLEMSRGMYLNHLLAACVSSVAKKSMYSPRKALVCTLNGSCKDCFAFFCYTTGLIKSILKIFSMSH
jgi:hypothetical protein